MLFYHVIFFIYNDMIKYNEFITESQIYKLILEGKMVFSQKFIEIVNNIWSRTDDQSVKNLAQDIFQNENRFVNINSNYIDISDDPKMVWFTPDDKVNKDEILYRLKRNLTGVVLSSNGYTLKRIGITERIDYVDINLLYEFDFKVLKEISDDQYPSCTFYLVELDNGNKVAFCLDNTDNQNPLQPSKTISKSKTKVRFGRFLNAFLEAIGSKYTSATIEKFVNLFQSEVELENNAMSFFKLVKGNEIKKWYHHRNYASNSGQLGNSCMRYDKCQSYFDIYTRNSDVCQLLIYEKDDKLLGRALVWTLDNGKRYMDRIYTIKDNIDIFFIRWADENNVSYSSTEQMKVNLSINWDIDFIIDENIEFPYMDTFKYYKPDESYLTNEYKGITRPYLKLDSTSGSADINR